MVDEDDIRRVEERIKATREWLERIDLALRGDPGAPGLSARVAMIESVLAPSDGHPPLPVRLDRLDRSMDSIRWMSRLVLAAVVANFADRVWGLIP